MFHPLQMIHYYRHLTVATRVGPPVVVDVHRYKCRNLRFGGTVAAEGFKNAIIRAKREHPDPNDARDIELAHTFTGKGYPDEISRSLTTVLRLHMYDASLGIGPGLQRICDEHIGLDCNGFSGNFAKKANLTHSHDPADRAPRDWGEEPYRRRAINEVQANDVLVWTSGIHMAVVEGHAGGPLDAPGRMLNVCESFDEGLRMYVYTILSFNAGTKVFQIRAPGHGEAEVYIARMH